MPRKSRFTEKYIREAARRKGGDLVEIHYVNGRRKAKLICRRKHQWSITPYYIDKTWCLECSGSKKYTMDDIQSIADERSGTCLSVEYFNKNTLLTWKCKYNHIFELPLAYVIGKHKTWCPECDPTRKPSQKICNQLAGDQDGECLSEYVDSSSKMTWKCHRGHIWEAAYNTIQKGHWCPTCGYHAPSQDDVDQLAINKGGKCLSQYVCARDKMKWKCAKGHIWEATYANINNRSWCPKCRNKTEQYCRSILECIFQDEFPNYRPVWLKNSENYRLELDGYNKDLKIAFEYNGLQHYEVVNAWQMTEEKLAKIQEHDRIKVEECRKRNIILIVIPCFKKTKKEIREFIYSEIFDWTLDEYSDIDLPPHLCLD